MEIDWSKAPKDATHTPRYSPGAPWLKQEGICWVFWEKYSRSWEPLTIKIPDIVTLVQRPESSKLEWTGEGLAPVGTVCEFVGIDSSDWHRELRNGAEVTIIAHFDGPHQRLAAFTFECTGGLQVEQGTEACFSPIRTAEQKAAEEREAWVQEFCKELAVPHSIGSRAHDAGYRKIQP